MDRLAIPIGEAKDGVGLTERKPTFDVVELPSLDVAGCDMRAVELTGELLQLGRSRSRSSDPHRNRRLHQDQQSAIDHLATFEGLDEALAIKLGGLRYEVVSVRASRR